MYTLEKNNTSPLCTLCMLMPQIIPHLTLMLVHMCYEESTPRPVVALRIEKHIGIAGSAIFSWS